MQREIAENVARALQAEPAPAPAIRGEKYAPRNMEAYESYLRGRQLVGPVLAAPAAAKRRRMFRRAIALDPDYAQAHAGLADALAQHGAVALRPGRAGAARRHRRRQPRARPGARPRRGAHGAGPPALARRRPRRRAPRLRARARAQPRAVRRLALLRARLLRARRVRARRGTVPARAPRAPGRLHAAGVRRRFAGSARRQAPARTRWRSAPRRACCASASSSRTTCARTTSPPACCTRSGAREEGRRDGRARAGACGPTTSSALYNAACFYSQRRRPRARARPARARAAPRRRLPGLDAARHRPGSAARVAALPGAARQSHDATTSVGAHSVALARRG